MLLWLFKITIFVGSFLLFMVQPMVGKILLPILGGTPAVWTTCMLFFQAALLVGHIYAERSIALLNCQRQALLHFLLLIGAFLLLPLHIDTTAAATAVFAPTTWLLTRLISSIGVIFILISAQAPLLQRYYAETGQPDADDPYFLYAASNLGSLLALLSYPLVIEPWIPLSQQCQLWSGLYLGLTLLMLLCCLCLWRYPPKSATTVALTAARPEPNLTGDQSYTVDQLFDQLVAEEKKQAAAARRAKARWKKPLYWALLAFVPSSAMLAVTTYIAVDIASVPLLWVVPLSLYLISFIMAFGRNGLWQRLKLERHLFPALLLAMLFYHFRIIDKTWFTIPLHLAVVFLLCLYFHLRLAQDRPAVAQLNSFYVWMSVGGIAGGLFNGLLAPFLFATQVEYILTLLLSASLCSYLAASYQDPEYSKRHRALVAGVFLLLLYFPAWLDKANAKCLSDSSGLFMALMALLTLRVFNSFRRGAWVLLCCIVLAASLQSLADPKIVMTTRSFFGVLRVTRIVSDGEVIDPDLKVEGAKEIFYCLSHGTTLHGIERKLDNMRMSLPLAYYAREGPIGSVFRVGNLNRAFKNIGVVGLGCGTLAWYGRPWQHFDFFEIDDKVVEIAQNPEYFTFLQNTQASVRHLPGDARMSLLHVPDQSYDLLILDAYSSDAVPMHLMSVEAVRLYLAKLKPDGMLLFHISNRYFKLAPVLKRICDELGIACLRAQDDPIHYSIRYDWYDYDQLNRTDWVAAGNPRHLSALQRYLNWEEMEPNPKFPLWTDDYANLLSVYMW